MGVWRLVYDKNVLKRLWAAGKTHVEIAAALGCSAGYVEKLRIRHGLPRRPRCHHGPQDDDPTPEQIAERAAECRARRPGLPEPKGERVSIPKYSWDGYRFHGLS
jgi:hypothetical protein